MSTKRIPVAPSLSINIVNNKAAKKTARCLSVVPDNHARIANGTITCAGFCIGGTRRWQSIANLSRQVGVLGYGRFDPVGFIPGVACGSLEDPVSPVDQSNVI